MQTAPGSMTIGILQTGHTTDAVRAEVGAYDGMFHRLLAGRGFSFRTWSVVDGEMPGDVDDADGWLVTGSRHGAYDDLPWIAPLEAFLRRAFEARVPIVGICFGHQILAQALGGRVEKWPGGWTVGRQVYDFGGREVALNAWHQDQVTAAPEAAEIIAAGPGCGIAGLRYGDRAFSVQAHPEFDAAVIRSLIAHRSGAVPPERVAAARDRLVEPVDNDALAGEIAAFFRAPRDRGGLAGHG